jgi:hypothetical protein
MVDCPCGRLVTMSGSHDEVRVKKSILRQKIIKNIRQKEYEGGIVEVEKSRNLKMHRAYS